MRFGIDGTVGIFGLDLRQRRGDDEQAVWTFAHAPQPIDKDGAIGGERSNQVSEIFSLDDA